MSPRRRSCASMPTSPTSGASRASPPGCCGSPVTSSKEDVDELRDPDLASAGEGILATGLGNDPQQNLLRRELATHMTQALAQLPEKHRAILVLREVEGLSYEVLARIPEYREAAAERRGTSPRPTEGAQGARSGIWAWIRHHRFATAMGTLVPALAAVAIVIYVGRGQGPGPDDVLVQVTAEGSATVLDTSDGPVVLFGEDEPAGT